MSSLPSGLAPPPCRSFQVPKRGHPPEECEDAFACDVARGRYAVADGATESSHSGLWADLLVREFVHRPEEPEHWINWLPELQARWRKRVEAADGAPPLPWYAEVRLQEGAFATFLGLTIDRSGLWQAWAVGDSCLFQVRRNVLLEKIPLKAASEFGASPWLVGSRTSDEVSRRQGTPHQGDWQPGDRFWLMTDALAHWFLREFEARGGAPWRTLETLLGQSEEDFAAWVEQQRLAGRLRNDDVTLVGVCL